MKTRLQFLRVLVLVASLVLAGCQSRVRTEHPFAGVSCIERIETTPRPMRMHIVRIDLDAPGIRFLVTPPKGHPPRETVRQTTLAFLIEQHAQIAINAHFFTPWPTEDTEVDLKGLAASDGRIYSTFEHDLAYPFQKNLPALNIAADNTPTIVYEAAGDTTGIATEPQVAVHNALSGNEQILCRGANVTGTGKWDNALHPRTAIGIAPGRKLVLFVVDGRQPGISEGMKTSEVAAVLARDCGVTDAINLDGGGSTTLAMADPNPRMVNVPVGINNVPGTLRAVGSNLAVFAKRCDRR